MIAMLAAPKCQSYITVKLLGKLYHVKPDTQVALFFCCKRRQGIRIDKSYIVIQLLALTS